MKAREDHRCEVFGSPWPGVFGTCIDSKRHYGRHWHATYGFGVLEHGAQRSASGRGTVEAHAGDLITTNPGEVHDGRPFGGPSRRWRMLYLEPAALAAMAGERPAAAVEFTRPVFRDGRLLQSLQQLFVQLDHWRAGRGDLLAAEESLVRACGLMLQ